MLGRRTYRGFADVKIKKVFVNPEKWVTYTKKQPRGKDGRVLKNVYNYQRQKIKNLHIPRGWFKKEILVCFHCGVDLDIKDQIDPLFEIAGDTAVCFRCNKCSSINIL